MTSATPSPSMSPSAGDTYASTPLSNMTSSLPVSPASIAMLAENLTGQAGETVIGSISDLSNVATMTSGTSQRSIAPSPLSSVMFATRGVLQLPVTIGTEEGS